MDNLSLFSNYSSTPIRRKQIFKTLLIGTLFYGSCLSIDQAQGMQSLPRYALRDRPARTPLRKSESSNHNALLATSTTTNVSFTANDEALAQAPFQQNLLMMSSSRSVRSDTSSNLLEHSLALSGDTPQEQALVRIETDENASNQFLDISLMNLSASPGTEGDNAAPSASMRLLAREGSDDAELIPDTPPQFINEIQKTQKEALEAELEKLTKNSAEAQKALNEQMDDLRQELTSKQSELEQLQNTLNEKASEIEKITEEQISTLQEAKKKIEALEEAFEELTKKSADETQDLCHERYNLSEELKLKRSELEHLQKTAEEKASELQKELAEKEAELQNFLDEKNKLEEKNSRIVENNKLFKDEIKASQSKIKALEEEVVTLSERKSEDVAKILSESEESARRLTSDLRASQERIQELENELLSSRKQQTDLQALEVLVRNSIIDSLTSLNRSAEQDFIQLLNSQPTAELSKELSQASSLYNADILSLERENENLRNQIEELRSVEANDAAIEDMF